MNDKKQCEGHILCECEDCVDFWKNWRVIKKNKSKITSITIPLSQIDALPNNEKLGEYVRSLRNNL